jgi:hypothetical protein
MMRSIGKKRPKLIELDEDRNALMMNILLERKRQREKKNQHKEKDNSQYLPPLQLQNITTQFQRDPCIFVLAVINYGINIVFILYLQLYCNLHKKFFYISVLSANDKVWICRTCKSNSYQKLLYTRSMWHSIHSLMMIQMKKVKRMKLYLKEDTMMDHF